MIGYLDSAHVVDGFANSMPHHHPTGAKLTMGDTLTSREIAAPAQHLVSPSRNCARAIDSLASQRPSELIAGVKTRFDDLESTAGPPRYNVLGSRKSTAEQDRAILQQTRHAAAVKVVKNAVAKSKNSQQKRIGSQVSVQKLDIF
eukprot:536407_1